MPDDDPRRHRDHVHVTVHPHADVDEGRQERMQRIVDHLTPAILQNLFSVTDDQTIEAIDEPLTEERLLEAMNGLSRIHDDVVARSRRYGRDQVMREWFAMFRAINPDAQIIMIGSRERPEGTRSREWDSYYQQGVDPRAPDSGAGATIVDLIDDIDAVLADYRSDDHV